MKTSFKDKSRYGVNTLNIYLAMKLQKGIFKRNFSGFFFGNMYNCFDEIFRTPLRAVQLFIFLQLKISFAFISLENFTLLYFNMCQNPFDVKHSLVSAIHTVLHCVKITSKFFTGNH